MEQSANTPNFNSDCSQAKRQKLLEEQGSILVREEFQSDDDDSNELPPEQQKDVASDIFTGGKIKNIEIETNSAAECMEIAEYIEHTDEQSDGIFVNSLETINDDCLREILKNLQIMDFVNLARTCERLHQFAKDEMLPKAANQICIVAFIDDMFMLRTPSYSQECVEVNADSLEIAFRYFGEFVESLSLTNVRSEKILPYCHNLKKLNHSLYTYASRENHVLQNQIESIQHLIELNLIGDGVTYQWRSSNCNSNVTKLTLKTADNIARSFVDYFRNLTSLSLDLTNTTWQFINFQLFFDNNRHCLKYLKLKNLSGNTVPDVFTRLLTESLPVLEYLEIDFVLSDGTMWLSDLPHLKSVSVICRISINPFLRMLSERGIIEDLHIGHGIFDESVAQPTLNFQKLRTISWSLEKSWTGILPMLTRSQIPEIQSAKFMDIKITDLDNLCEFIESKTTLNSISFQFSGGVIPLSFWCRIIRALKATSASRRTILTCRVCPISFEKEVVSKIPFKH